MARPKSRCACGNVIFAESLEAPAIESAVRAHNGSPTHRVWRRRREKVNANAIRRMRNAHEIVNLRHARALVAETLKITR